MLKLSVSSKTVQRLQEMELRYYKAKCKPHINQFNMKRRLAFAKKYASIILEKNNME